jgi:hypothetical protein
MQYRRFSREFLTNARHQCHLGFPCKSARFECTASSRTSCYRFEQ